MESKFLEEVFVTATKPFEYLKSRGMIDIGVCWKCGEEPISGDYLFRMPDDSKSYPICQNCSTKGRKIQKEKERLFAEPYPNDNKSNSSIGRIILIGATVLIIILILTW